MEKLARESKRVSEADLTPSQPFAATDVPLLNALYTSAVLMLIVMIMCMLMRICICRCRRARVCAHMHVYAMCMCM